MASGRSAVRDDGRVTTNSPTDLLDLALTSARAAGELLRDGVHRELIITTKSSPTDVVSEMDQAAEALLIELLLGARPDDGILGEEGAATAGTSGVRWVVDPLDGTVNYLYGMPGWAVSVAAEIDGVAVAGVVHAPALGETYLASLGGGAILIDARGEHPMRVRECDDLASALIATGFGYLAERRRAQAAVVAQLLPVVRDIRRAGACAIDLAWVAAGRLDGYFERGAHRWDHAAGALIAREAGAVVGGLRGQPEGEDLILCAVPSVFPALHDVLSEWGADSD